MVFFIADAAVTSGRPLRSPTSSFGEAHQPGSVSVEQAALKIFRLPNNAGITFAGDVRLGNSFVAGIEHFLTSGAEPADAIEKAYALPHR